MDTRVTYEKNGCNMSVNVEAGSLNDVVTTTTYGLVSYMADETGADLYEIADRLCAYIRLTATKELVGND